MVNRIKKLLIFFSLIIVFVININVVFAGIVNCGLLDSGKDACTINDLFGGAKTVVVDGKSVTINNDPFWITFINMALGISGIVILCIFVYSGINIMLFGSDSNKLKKSVAAMKGSFIGILLVFFAFTIVRASLAILVGDKWSIYFGQGDSMSTNTTSGTNGGAIVNSAPAAPAPAAPAPAARPAASAPAARPAAPAPARPGLTAEEERNRLLNISLNPNCSPAYEGNYMNLTDADFVRAEHGELLLCKDTRTSLLNLRKDPSKWTWNCDTQSCFVNIR